MPTHSRTTSPKRGHRPQVNELVAAEDARPLVVRPLVVRPLVKTDRAHNPDDIVVDDAAIAAGIQHGGDVERRAETLQVRGSGGRKRSGARGRHRTGRDNSKKR